MLANFRSSLVGPFYKWAFYVSCSVLHFINFIRGDAELTSVLSVFAGMKKC